MKNLSLSKKVAIIKKQPIFHSGVTTLKTSAFLLFWSTGLLANSVFYAKPAPIVETRHAIEISIGGIGPRR